MSGAKASSHPGVRYRESKMRKNGIKPDRYFFIRYRQGQKLVEEGVGWASEEMTAQKAAGLLAIIRENIRTGKHPQSLSEMRAMNEELQKEKKRQDQADALAALTLQMFWEGEYVPSASLTKTAHTIETEISLYKKWIAPLLKKQTVGSISADSVDRVVQKVLRAGKSEQTARHTMALLSQIWTMAHRKGIATGENPVRSIKKPQKDSRRVRFLTYDEARSLLEALEVRSKDMHDAALLSLYAGLRAGEIHSLLWGDVDFEAEHLYIRDPKNKNSRHAYMNTEIKEMLETRYAGQEKGMFVFPATNGGKRMTVPTTFERVVLELGMNNGITDSRQKVVFHSLRHTFASWLVQRGTPLYTVAQLMGHSSLEMTKRYAHLAPDTVRAAAMQLEGVLK